MVKSYVLLKTPIGGDTNMKFQDNKLYVQTSKQHTFSTDYVGYVDDSINLETKVHKEIKEKIMTGHNLVIFYHNGTKDKRNFPLKNVLGSLHYSEYEIYDTSKQGIIIETSDKNKYELNEDSFVVSSLVNDILNTYDYFTNVKNASSFEIRLRDVSNTYPQSIYIRPYPLDPSDYDTALMKRCKIVNYLVLEYDKDINHLPILNSLKSRNISGKKYLLGDHLLMLSKKKHKDNIRHMGDETILKHYFRLFSVKKTESKDLLTLINSKSVIELSERRSCLIKELLEIDSKLGNKSSYTHYKLESEHCDPKEEKVIVQLTNNNSSIPDAPILFDSEKVQTKDEVRNINLINENHRLKKLNKQLDNERVEILKKIEECQSHLNGLKELRQKSTKNQIKKLQDEHRKSVLNAKRENEEL